MDQITPMIDSSGTEYDIPRNEVKEFQSDMGSGAQRQYLYRTEDGTDYAVPESEAKDFLSDFPNAQPVRRFQFADGSTEDVPANGMKDFFRRYRSDDRYRDDRDAARAAAEKSAGPAESPVWEGVKGFLGSFGRALWNPAAEWGEQFGEDSAGAVALAGADDAANSIAAGVLKLPSGIGKAFGYALGGRGTSAGSRFIDDAQGFERTVDRALPQDEKSERAGYEMELANKVQNMTSTLFNFALAGTAGAAGAPAIVAIDSTDAYVDTYDRAVARGAAPEEANAIANEAFMWNAIMEGTLINGGIRPMYAGAQKMAARPTLDLTRRTFSGITRGLTVGALRNYAARATGHVLSTGAIMGTDAAGKELLRQDADGEGRDWAKTGEAAMGGAAEGGLMGLMFGTASGLTAAAEFRAYHRAMKKSFGDMIMRNVNTAQGREAMARANPRGTYDFLKAREDGGTPSRTLSDRMILPDSLSAAERAEVADMFLKDGITPERIKAEMEARRPRPEPVGAETAGTRGQTDGGALPPAEPPAPVEPPRPSGPVEPPAGGGVARPLRAAEGETAPAKPSETPSAEGAAAAEANAVAKPAEGQAAPVPVAEGAAAAVAPSETGPAPSASAEGETAPAGGGGETADFVKNPQNTATPPPEEAVPTAVSPKGATSAAENAETAPSPAPAVAADGVDAPPNAAPKPSRPKTSPRAAASAVKDFACKGKEKAQHPAIAEPWHDKAGGVVVATNGRILIATRHGFDPNAPDAPATVSRWKDAVPDDKALTKSIEIDPAAAAEACRTALRIFNAIGNKRLDETARVNVVLHLGDVPMLFQAKEMLPVFRAMAANGITRVEGSELNKPVVARNGDTTIVAMPLRGDDVEGRRNAVAPGRHGDTVVVDANAGRIVAAPVGDVKALRTRLNGADMTPKERASLERRIVVEEELDALLRGESAPRPSAMRPVAAQPATSKPGPASSVVPADMPRARADSEKSAERHSVIDEGRRSVLSSPNAKTHRTGKGGVEKIVYTPKDGGERFTVGKNAFEHSLRGQNAKDNAIVGRHLGEALDASVPIGERSENATFRISPVKVGGVNADVLFTIVDGRMTDFMVLKGFNTKKDPKGMMLEVAGGDAAKAFEVRAESISNLERSWQERFKPGLVEHARRKGESLSFLPKEKARTTSQETGVAAPAPKEADETAAAHRRTAVLAPRPHVSSEEVIAQPKKRITPDGGNVNGPATETTAIIGRALDGTSAKTAETRRVPMESAAGEAERPERPKEYSDWLAKYRLEDTDARFREWQGKQKAAKPAPAKAEADASGPAEKAPADAPAKAATTAPAKDANPAGRVEVVPASSIYTDGITLTYTEWERRMGYGVDPEDFSSYEWRCKAAGHRDAQGNPVDKNGKLAVQKVSDVSKVADGDFLAPTRNVQLPALPKNVDAAIGAEGRPVIIKRNIFEKNYTHHPELTPAASRDILERSLYNPNLVGQTQPSTRPHYMVAIQTGDGNAVTVLDVSKSKDGVEIVGWRTVNERGLELMKKQAAKEGGQLLVLHPSEDGQSVGFSDRHRGSTEGNVPKSAPEVKAADEMVEIAVQGQFDRKTQRAEIVVKRVTRAEAEKMGVPIPEPGMAQSMAAASRHVVNFRGRRESLDDLISVGAVALTVDDAGTPVCQGNGAGERYYPRSAELPYLAKLQKECDERWDRRNAEDKAAGRLVEIVPASAPRRSSADAKVDGVSIGDGNHPAEEAVARFDAANGTEVSQIVELTNALSSGDRATVQKFSRRYLTLAKTGEFLKQIGIKGEKFTIGSNSIKRHDGAGTNHAITPDEWMSISESLSSGRPLGVTRYYNPQKKSVVPDAYRIWTRATIGGKTAIVGVEVKSDARNLFVNSVNTVFGLTDAGIREELLVYPKSIEEFRSVLADQTRRRYPETPATRRNIAQTAAEVNGPATETTAIIGRASDGTSAKTAETRRVPMESAAGEAERPERPKEYSDWLAKYRLEDTDARFREWQGKQKAAKPAPDAARSAKTAAIMKRRGLQKEYAEKYESWLNRRHAILKEDGADTDARFEEWLMTRAGEPERLKRNMPDPDARAAAKVVKDFACKGKEKAQRPAIAEPWHDKAGGVVVATNGRILIATKHGFDPDAPDAPAEKPRWRQVVPDDRKLTRAVEVDPAAAAETCRAALRLARARDGKGLTNVRVVLRFGDIFCVFDGEQMLPVFRAMAANGITRVKGSDVASPFVARNDDTTIVAMPLRHGEAKGADLVTTYLVPGRHDGSIVIAGESGRVIAAPDVNMENLRLDLKAARNRYDENRAVYLGRARKSSIYKVIRDARAAGETDAEKVYGGVGPGYNSWERLSPEVRAEVERWLGAETDDALAEMVGEYLMMNDGQYARKTAMQHARAVEDAERRIAAEEELDALLRGESAPRPAKAERAKPPVVPKRAKPHAAAPKRLDPESATPQEVADVIAERYVQIYERRGLRPKPPSAFVGTAEALIGNVRGRNADALIETVANGQNPGSLRAFEVLTGIKMPKSQREQRAAIDRFCGITPEERAKMDAERRAADVAAADAAIRKRAAAMADRHLDKRLRMPDGSSRSMKDLLGDGYAVEARRRGAVNEYHLVSPDGRLSCRITADENRYIASYLSRQKTPDVRNSPADSAHGGLPAEAKSIGEGEGRLPVLVGTDKGVHVKVDTGNPKTADGKNTVIIRRAVSDTLDLIKMQDPVEVVADVPAFITNDHAKYTPAQRKEAFEYIAEKAKGQYGEVRNRDFGVFRIDSLFKDEVQRHAIARKCDMEAVCAARDIAQRMVHFAAAPNEEVSRRNGIKYFEYGLARVRLSDGDYLVMGEVGEKANSAKYYDQRVVAKLKADFKVPPKQGPTQIEKSAFDTVYDSRFRILLQAVNSLPAQSGMGSALHLRNSPADSAHGGLPNAGGGGRAKQTALSGETSLNQNPAGNRVAQMHGVFKRGTRNVDIGAGKYGRATEFLNGIGVENIPFDPVNRDAETNRRAAEAVRANPADTATVHNVLNVIDNDEVMEGVVNQAARAIRPDGTAVFTIYEGDRSGRGRATSKGYQRNAKASAYVPVLKKYFGEVETHGNVVFARRPKDVGPAFWAFDSGFDEGVRFLPSATGYDALPKRWTSEAKARIGEFVKRLSNAMGVEVAFVDRPADGRPGANAWAAFDRRNGRITLYPGAEPSDVVHETTHALRLYAETEAEAGRPELLDKLDEIAEDLPVPVRDAVAAAHAGENGGRPIAGDVLMDELLAHELGGRADGVFGKSLGTAEGRAWYSRAWEKIKELWRAMLRRLGMDRADLDRFMKMKPSDAAQWIVEQMAAGRRLGRLKAAEGAHGGAAADGRRAEAMQTKNAVQNMRTVETPNVARSYAEARARLAPQVGKTFHNKETGIAATLSNNSVNKLLSGKAVAKSVGVKQHLAAVANVVDLFENGKLLETDVGTRKGVASAKRFYSQFTYGGEDLVAKTTVLEYEHGDHRIYSVEAMEVEKAGSILAPNGSENQAESPALPLTPQIIPQSGAERGERFSIAGRGGADPTHPPADASHGGLPAEAETETARTEYDEVVARYTDRDGTRRAAWMKAPNGKPTKLTERQWVQVRTPSFKRWFGDWEAAATLSAIEGLQSIEVKDLADGFDAKAAYSSLGNGKNALDGREVRFVNATLGKILRHKGYDTARLVPYLKEVFNAAIPLGFEKERAMPNRGDGTPHKEHRNFVGYHNYLGKISDGGRTYFVRFTVQELRTRSKSFVPNEVHSTFVSDVELYSEADLLALNTAKSAGKVGAVGLTDGIVAKYLTGFKEARENSSKVVDENGEPMVVYHGTNATEEVETWNARTRTYDVEHRKFTVFRRDAAGERNAGHFFSDSADVAGSMGGEVYAAVLSMRNPLVVDAQGRTWGGVPFDGGFRDANEVAAYAEAHGHDGLILRNVRDGAGFGEMEGTATDYVVFNSNQIKSATENSGAFDAGNPDIRFAPADSAHGGLPAEAKSIGDEAGEYAAAVDAALAAEEGESAGGPAAPEGAPRGRGTGVLPGGDPTSLGAGTRRWKVVTPQTFLREARRLFPDVAIRHKSTARMAKWADGHFEPTYRLIRARDMNSIGTVSHELGHEIEHLTRYDVLRLPAVKRDLSDLGHHLYGPNGPKPKSYVGEGFAEYVRGYVCDAPNLHQVAPDLDGWFRGEFARARPDVVKRLDRLRDMVQTMKEQSAAQLVDEFMRPSSTAVERAWNRVKEFLSSENWNDSNAVILRAMRKSGMDRLFRWQDEFRELERCGDPKRRAALAKSVTDKIESNPYLFATTVRGTAAQRVMDMARHGTTTLLGNRRTGESMREIFADFTPDEIGDWKRYAVARHGIANYFDKGLDFGLPKEVLEAVVAQHGSQKFEDALRRFTDYSHRILHLGVDAGLITQETYDGIVKNHPIYVRITRRHDVDGARAGGGGAAINRRTGGFDHVFDPIDAALMDQEKYLRACFQAKTLQLVVRAGERAAEANADSERRNGGPNTANANPRGEAHYAVAAHWPVRVPNAQEAVTFSAAKLGAQLGRAAGDFAAKTGADPVPLGEFLKGLTEDDAPLLTIFRDRPSHGRRNLVSVHLDGKLRTYELPDMKWADMLLGIDEDGGEMGWLEKIAARATSALRLGATTLNPAFAVRNAIRDTLHAAIVSETGAVPGLNTLNGMLKELMGHESAAMFRSMGGHMSDLVGVTREQKWNHGGKVALAQNGGQALRAYSPSDWLLMKPVVKACADVLALPEIGPRLNEMAGVLKKCRDAGLGEDAAAILAMGHAKDVSIDFQRAGKCMRRLNRLVPFLNAGWRGMEQGARNLGMLPALPHQFEDRRGVRAAKTAVLGTAMLTALNVVVALMEMSGDDDERRAAFERAPSEKWEYLRIGDWRIPMPFEYGMLFGSLPRAIVYEMHGDRGAVRECLAAFAKSLPLKHLDPETAANSVAAVSPVLDVMRNRDWRGRPIVQQHVMDNYEKKDWKGPYTTKLSVRLGELLGQSPAQLEHVLDGYTGGGWRRAAVMAENFGDLSRLAEGRGLSFVDTLRARPNATRLVEDFYRRGREWTRAANSGTIGLEDYGRLAAHSATAKALTAITKDVFAVRADKSLSLAERDRRIEALQARKNDEVRAFNALGDFRRLGVASAAAKLTNGDVGEEDRRKYLGLLKGVSKEEAADALVGYGSETVMVKVRGVETPRRRWGQDALTRRIRRLHQLMRE